MNKQDPIKLVGWIIWWVETVLMVGGMGLTWFGSAMMSGMGGMMGHQWFGGSMMSGSSRLFGLGMLAGGFWLLWRVVIQIVAYIAIRHLDDRTNLTWPVLLIVLTFLGGFLYLIPGIWGIITYYQEPRQN